MLVCIEPQCSGGSKKSHWLAIFSRCVLLSVQKWWLLSSWHIGVEILFSSFNLRLIPRSSYWERNPRSLYTEHGSEVPPSEKRQEWCLLWWLNGKESTCNAGDMGSLLEPGIFHMPQSNKVSAPQLLSLCSAATAEARMPRAHALRQEKPQQWEAWALQLESSLYLLQLGKRPQSNEDPEQPEIKK